MRATINFDFDMEDDGIEGSVQLNRSNVDNLEDLMYLFQAATVSAGFTYVEAVGAHKEGGNVVWSGF